MGQQGVDITKIVSTPGADNADQNDQDMKMMAALDNSMLMILQKLNARDGLIKQMGNQISMLENMVMFLAAKTGYHGELGEYIAKAMTDLGGEVETQGKTDDLPEKD